MKWVKGVSFALMCAVIWACGGSGAPTNTTPNPVIRFFNAVPDSTTMTSWANDIELGGGVAYLGSTASFASVEAGDYDIACEDDSDPSTYDSVFQTMNRDQDFITLAIGLINFGPEDEKRMRPVAFPFNRIRPNGDKAKLIIVNALHRAAGNQNVPIDFQNPGDTPRFRLQNIGFAANGQELLVDAVSDTFVARRNLSELEVTPRKTFTFEGGKIYLALVTGVEDATGASAPKIEFIELQSR